MTLSSVDTFWRAKFTQYSPGGAVTRQHYSYHLDRAGGIAWLSAIEGIGPSSGVIRDYFRHLEGVPYIASSCGGGDDRAVLSLDEFAWGSIDLDTAAFRVPVTLDGSLVVRLAEFARRRGSTIEGAVQDLLDSGVGSVGQP